MQQFGTLRTRSLKSHYNYREREGRRRLFGRIDDEMMMVLISSEQKETWFEDSGRSIINKNNKKLTRESFLFIT